MGASVAAFIDISEAKSSAIGLVLINSEAALEALYGFPGFIGWSSVANPTDNDPYTSSVETCINLFSLGDLLASSNSINVPSTFEFMNSSGWAIELPCEHANQ